MKPSHPQIRGADILQELLAELAFVLLPRGMTPKRFGELARCAFVQAASDISKLRNGRVNYSRIAAQTGLSRADVKRALTFNALASPVLRQTAVEKVVNGWCTDPRFAARGRPRTLMISGAGASFANLVVKYGGDVPHRAILDELRRIGAVKGPRTKISLHAPIVLRKRQDFAFLSPVLPTLIDALRIASKREAHSSIHRLCIPVKSDIDLTIVRERSSASAKSMLEGMRQSLGKQVTVPSRATSPSYSFTITVLLAERRATKQRPIQQMS